MSLPCPNCGADLRFIEDYGRQYCDACGQYAPEGYGGGKGLGCPKCGGVLAYIPDYDRYFCYKDQEYAPDDYGKEPAPPPEDSGELPRFDELLPPEPEGPPPAAPPPEIPAPTPAVDVQAASTPPPQTIPEAAPAPPSSPSETPAEPATPPVKAPPEPAPVAPAMESIPPSVPLSGRRKETGVRVIEAGAIREAKRETGRPPLVREDIARAKKSALMDLANAHGLESMGTKEDLKERLIAELDRRDAEERRAREEAAGPAEVPATPEPQALASVEDVKAAIEARPPAVEPEARAAEPAYIDSSEPPATGQSEPAPVSERAASEEVRPPVQESSTTPAWMIEPAAEPTPGATVAPAATPVPETPTAVPEAPRVINPCPTCGRELSYLDPYDRYYCYHCKAYAPPVVKVETVPAPPRVGKPCPTCGRELTFIPDYNRHYCYNCKKYAPLEGRPAETPSPAPAVEVAPPPKPEPAPAPMPPPAVEIVAVKYPCPTCGRELSFIEKYGRFYCYSCKKYAPARVRNPCPNCGKELTYIAQYGRHYCPACGQYAPKEMTARILAARSMAVSAAMAAATAPSAAAATRTATVAVHRHANPGGGIALMAAGLVALLLYGALWAIPTALNGAPYFTVGSASSTSALGAVVELLGFLLLGLGAIMGLVRLRTAR